MKRRALTFARRLRSETEAAVVERLSVLALDRRRKARTRLAAAVQLLTHLGVTSALHHTRAERRHKPKPKRPSCRHRDRFGPLQSEAGIKLWWRCRACGMWGWRWPKDTRIRRWGNPVPAGPNTTPGLPGWPQAG